MLPETAGEAGAVAAILLALIAFIRLFLVRQIRDLTERVNKLEEKYDLERATKHKAFNDVARSVMALDLVRRLAEQCTCGVLDPLTEIIDRMFLEFETLQHNRRAGDPPAPEGATP